MATTPNFNWSTPDNTGLVKNGALDIRTLGNSIDASLVDLKGGTTGQVLSKASNTDMDFVWAADAGAPTSLGYAAGKNKIINGDFYINQRSFSSTTTSGAFMFDRWTNYLNNGTVTLSSQSFTLGSAPVSGYEGKSFLQCVTTGQTATDAAALVNQKIESVRTFANQTATISFWAKANSGTPKIAVEVSQGFGTGGSPSAAVNTYVGQVTLSTSWARYTVTVNVPSIAGKTIGTDNNDFFNLAFWVSAGTDFNARTGSLGIQSNTFGIWGVQIEAGSTATAFQTATGTIQGELAACQRYYYRLNGASQANYYTTGFAETTTTSRGVLRHPVEMRTSPTGTVGGVAANYANYTSSGTVTNNAIPALSSTYVLGALVTSTAASGLTAGQGLVMYALSGAYFEFSAEL